MHSNNHFESGLVRYIVEGAAQESARSLELLRAIELTVQVNEMLSESFEQISRRFTLAVEDICSRDPYTSKHHIDADSSIQASLETTLNILEQLKLRMISARRSAVADNELLHDDGVVESFDRVVLAISDAHSILNELNWAIMEHDAERAPLSNEGPFKTAKELIAAITK